MSLYRLNLHLSQEVFTLLSCFEVALRNAIDRQLTSRFGKDWLRDSVSIGGIFDIPSCRDSARIISKAYNRLCRNSEYSHHKLLAEMEFGVWKYMFANPQYRATGQILLRIFPNKPRSSAEVQYNNAYMFNELDGINILRNRIATMSLYVLRGGNLKSVPHTFSTSIRICISCLCGWTSIVIPCFMDLTMFRRYAIE